MLAWKDLCVIATGSGRVILENVHGYAEPGAITVIMGPSGSGKTTLLDTLAGRLSKNTKFSGNIFLNGHATRHLAYGVSAFVTQDDDALVGTLTVRESIAYSARLRLPDTMLSSEKQEMVEKAIKDMGLDRCADTRIGNWHMRGLSGGEKRRLSIALEILTRPRLIFLDEPTSGLDSASAFFVVQRLRRLANDGRTVIASVHQPSSEIFELFDSLCLLSQGKLIYVGATVSATQFFSTSGFPCPTLRNPSDHFLRITNTTFDKDLERQSRSEAEQSMTSEVVSVLMKSFQASQYGAMLTSKIQDMSQQKGEMIKSRGSQASFLTQTMVLTERSFKNMRRDVGYYWLRIGIYVVLNVAVGTIYFDIGTDFDAIQARLAFMFFIGAFLTIMSVGGFPSFVEDMKVFYRERLNGHYGVVAFIIANALSSLVFLFVISLICSGISYTMVKLHPGTDRFIYFVLNLFTALAVVESLMMAIASIVPNFLMGIISGSGVMAMFILVAGFFRLPNQLPKVFWKYPLSYIAFHPFSLEGMYMNDFIGLEFEQRAGPGLPKRSGESILRDDYQVTVEKSKWANLVVLVCMIVVYRMIFFALTKLAEKRCFKR